MTHTITAEPLRVALVGLGPKGLFALERMLDAAGAGPLSRPLEVVAFEPHPVPGAGPVYDPAQPDYLRMNFAADRVSVWPSRSCAVPLREQLPFSDWREQFMGDPARDAYVPRSQVGRYLSWCLEALVRHAPAHVALSLRRTAVTAVFRDGARWRVRAGGEDSEHDEVLIATGHARGWEGALSRGWRHAAPLVEAVFPVERRLAPAAVPAGARVAVRGFALTFIDAALALTEGRGGRFVPMGGGSTLVYRPSGAEPRSVLPFSRTGRPMLAKPDPGSDRPRSGDADAQERQAILALPAGFAVDDLAGIVERAAGRPGAGTALDEARGAAWRAVYPAIVERAGGDGLRHDDWPSFRALAAEMERVAFGPPPLNAAKLEALVEAGIVNGSHVAGGRLESTGGRTELVSPAGRANVDVVVDAVLPPPGVVGVDDPLLGRLIADGHARVLPGRRGVEVRADATCVAADGSPARGLAVCGRPTEDSVIGNDTLSRDLHPQLDRWAARVAARAREEAVAATGAGRT